MQKKKKKTKPKTFLLPGQAPGEVACLSLPGQVFSASCPQARAHCFLRRQGFACPSRPRVTTRLVEALAQEAGGLWRESVRWPGPGPLDPSPASCGLWAHHGCLRKLAGVSWANSAGPGSRLPFRQSPSQLGLQTAARVIVSASPSCECRVYRDRHANSAHSASGEGRESWALPGPLTLQIPRPAVDGGKLVGVFNGGERFLHTLPCAMEKHGGARGLADWQDRGEVRPQGHLLKPKKESQRRGGAQGQGMRGWKEKFPHRQVETVCWAWLGQTDLLTLSTARLAGLGDNPLPQVGLSFCIYCVDWGKVAIKHSETFLKCSTFNTYSPAVQPVFFITFWKRNPRHLVTLAFHLWLLGSAAEGTGLPLLASALPCCFQRGARLCAEEGRAESGGASWASRRQLLPRHPATFCPGISSAQGSSS